METTEIVAFYQVLLQANGSHLFFNLSSCFILIRNLFAVEFCRRTLLLVWVLLRSFSCNFKKFIACKFHIISLQQYPCSWSTLDPENKASSFSQVKPLFWMCNLPPRFTMALMLFFTFHVF